MIDMVVAKLCFVFRPVHLLLFAVGNVFDVFYRCGLRLVDYSQRTESSESKGALAQNVY